MSNRRKTARARRVQFMLNGGGGRSSGPVILRRPNGDLARTEGARNYAHGPVRQHPRRTLASLWAHIGRPRKAYPDHSRDGLRRNILEGMTRDELRVLAKAQNVSGWHKMNKNQLVEAILR